MCVSDIIITANNNIITICIQMNMHNDASRTPHRNESIERSPDLSFVVCRYVSTVDNQQQTLFYCKNIWSR